MCLYFAWILCAVTILTCSVVLVLYGIAFGNQKSWLWFITTIMSLFKDIILTQPIKILLISLLASVFFKTVNPQSESDVQNRNKIEIVEKVLFANVVNGDDSTNSDENEKIEENRLNNANSPNDLVIIDLD